MPGIASLGCGDSSHTTTEEAALVERPPRRRCAMRPPGQPGLTAENVTEWAPKPAAVLRVESLVLAAK